MRCGFRGFLKGNVVLGFFERKCGFRVFLKGNVDLGFLK